MADCTGITPLRSLACRVARILPSLFDFGNSLLSILRMAKVPGGFDPSVVIVRKPIFISPTGRGFGFFTQVQFGPPRILLFCSGIPFMLGPLLRPLGQWQTPGECPKSLRWGTQRRLASRRGISALGLESGRRTPPLTPRCAPRTTLSAGTLSAGAPGDMDACRWPRTSGQRWEEVGPGLIHHGLDAPDGMTLWDQGVGRNRCQLRGLPCCVASHSGAPYRWWTQPTVGSTCPTDFQHPAKHETELDHVPSRQAGSGKSRPRRGRLELGPSRDRCQERRILLCCGPRGTIQPTPSCA